MSSATLCLVSTAQGQIAQLFVVGFLSSMIVGTYVGALADKYGRRKMCMAFGVIYILSCCTKVSRQQQVTQCLLRSNS